MSEAIENQRITVDIKPSTDVVVTTLEDIIPSGHHQERFVVQDENKGLYLVGWHDGQPVGHALIRWNGSVNPKLIEKAVTIPYIEAVEVRQGFESRGIGTQLMTAAEQSIKDKGYDRVGLAVGVNNARAIKLYEHLGYKTTQIGKFYDGTPEDGDWCVYLEKKL